jgi:hypothetical protein
MPTRERTQIELRPVSNQGQIRSGLEVFQTEAVSWQDAARSLAQQTQYWIYDPASNAFGPSKFVGFAGMSFALREKALVGKAEGARFDGGLTRRTIEKVLGRVYKRDAPLNPKLLSWAETLWGKGVFDGVDEGKWRFVKLAGQDAPPAQHSDAQARRLTSRQGADQEGGAGQSKKVWIFQANPDLFDIDRYLGLTKRILWTVRQAHLAPAMEPGDRVFLWRAGGKSKEPAGVLASGWLQEAPSMQLEDPVAVPLWKSPERLGRAVRVPIAIDRVATGSQEMVRREWLLRDPGLENLRILKLAGETNYLLEPGQGARVEALWARTGRDWTHAESLAALWAYQQTFGGSVSTGPGSPVSIVAQRIGRVLTGVYNKVMNFRALDPRDARKGLVAGGETDRDVWDRFYDPQVKQIRVAELDTEFNRLWPPNGGTQPEDVALEELVGASTGRGGQGLVSDPATRKAIEDRAMALAKLHYGKLFDDVSTTKPYDLCGRQGEVDVRVEVKGSTGDGTEIRLTAGEVRNARGRGWRTDLFIVRGIEVEPGPKGPVAKGGEEVVLEKWVPEEVDLAPLVFSYKVPLNHLKSNA